MMARGKAPQDRPDIRARLSGSFTSVISVLMGTYNASNDWRETRANRFLITLQAIVEFHLQLHGCEAGNQRALRLRLVRI
jgi:hypothetical protein